ncbi:MAG: hypothetical protein QG644_274 [Patescibacteria group bacterium]|nr:hypothetical protein [Patescibacteria group bacterium]
METRECKKCNKSFSMDKDELGFYQKMNVPIPKVCPDCRFVMKALFRNETTLYSGRKCDLCGKSIISIYHPKSPYTIYCYDCFYSEKWDAKNYALDYDESKPFLDQFKELMLKVPKINTYVSLGGGPNINSDYTNMTSGARNSYLIFNTTVAEDTMYTRGLRNVKDSCDLYFGTNVERCYDSINVQESNGILWSQNVSGCVDSAFILNGRGLINCFGCVNLNNKSYYFLNKQLTPEEYQEKVKEIMGSYEKIEKFKQEFKEFASKFPRRENNNIQTKDSSGDYIFRSKNVKDSFEVANSEYCRYAYSSKEMKDSYGIIGYGVKSEKMLEVVATGFSSNVIGSYGLENSTNILYGFYIRGCNNCIGCDGLHHADYAILNKTYLREEYERLKNKIIKELTDQDLYGLMIPPQLAPFAYNETIALYESPLEKEEVIKTGWRWEDDVQKTEGQETIKSENITDNIKNINNSIIKEILKCIDCFRNYKITEQEFIFYKKMNIPIPRKCFFCRHKDRIQKRGPYKFWDRKCAKCDKGIVTNYSPERPEIVYCEKCYQQEVY